MAKQSKRAAATRRRQETVRASVPARGIEARGVEARKVEARKGEGRRVEATKVEAVDFQVEYHYVLADLKRFGILAVAMIALLVVLALVL